MLQTLMGKADLTRIGSHGMRHTHVSILIQRGVKPTVVANRLGHKDVAFTLKTHAHLFKEQRRAAAMLMADFLGTLGIAPEAPSPVIGIAIRVLN